MKTDYTYEYAVIDPVTKGQYLVRTRRPKIEDQIQYHVRTAGKRAKRNEKLVLYALD